MNLKNIVALMIAFFITAAFPSHDSTGPYFYTHPDYGSQSMFNPLSVLFNGGYDIVQTGMYDSYLFRVPYRKSADNMIDNLTHPLRQIERHGWERFLGTEVFPSSTRIDRSQYLPNYTLHVLGGGTTYRMLCEWNKVHNVPSPKISAIAFATAYNFLNEVMENGSYTGVNVDPIADMWIFNPLGILLYSWDTMAHFFSSSVQVCDWSGMPFIDPVQGKIDNASQNWAVKIPLPFIDRTRLFVYLGMSEVAGLSYSIQNDYTLSGGAGFSVGDVVESGSGSDATGRVMTIKYSWNAGIFFDKSQSLLFSLVLSNSGIYKARANLYPLPHMGIGNFKPAFFAALGRNNDAVFGITGNWLPVSLSLRSK
jgi:hypothetical protein